MKKVYYSFVLVLMTLMSMNVLADTPIKLDVDDASRIRVKVNYSGSVLKPSCRPILLSA